MIAMAMTMDRKNMTRGNPRVHTRSNPSQRGQRKGPGPLSVYTDVAVPLRILSSPGIRLVEQGWVVPEEEVGKGPVEPDAPVELPQGGPPEAEPGEDVGTGHPDEGSVVWGDWSFDDDDHGPWPELHDES